MQKTRSRKSQANREREAPFRKPDVEMSGKFTLDFQEHVIAFEVLTSHGTSWCLPVGAGSSPILALSFAECDCAVDGSRPVCLLNMPLVL